MTKRSILCAALRTLGFLTIGLVAGLWADPVYRTIVAIIRGLIQWTVLVIALPIAAIAVITHARPLTRCNATAGALPARPGLFGFLLAARESRPKTHDLTMLAFDPGPVSWMGALIR